MTQTPTDSHNNEESVQAHVDHPTRSVPTDFRHTLCVQDETDAAEIDREICSTSEPRLIPTITSDERWDVTGESSEELLTLPGPSNVVPPPSITPISRVPKQSRAIQAKRAKLRLKIELPHTVPDEDKLEPNALLESVNKLLQNSMLQEYYPIMWEHIDTMRKFDEVHDRGSFGSVIYVTLNKPEKTIVAVKRVRYSQKRDKLLSIHAELSVLETTRTDRCDYIVGYLCTLRDVEFNRVYFWMEKMDTSLKKFNEILHSMANVTSEQLELFVRRCAYNIIKGLAFLKSKGFVHQDIKPDNILIDRNCAIKLADFGISGHTTTKEYEFESAVGTQLYMPPDVQQGSIQSDMWAVGITLLEIIGGKHPIAAEPSSQDAFRVQIWEPEFPETISPELRKFLVQLLQKEAKLRPPSYDDIINTTFIGRMSPNPSQDEIDFVQQVIDMMNPHSSLTNRG